MILNRNPSTDDIIWETTDNSLNHFLDINNDRFAMKKSLPTERKKGLAFWQGLGLKEVID